MKKAYRIFLLVCLCKASLVFSEEKIVKSEEKIVKFDERYALSLFGNYNMGIFMQGQTQGFRTDEPWRLGLGFRYKKYSASFTIPLDFKFNSFDAEFNLYFEKIYFELYMKRYQSYYNYKDKTKENENAGLDIMSTGIAAGWIHNNQNHSLSSVYSLNEKQNSASGSFLYGFGLYYTSIYSENYDIKHYNERNYLIHFGPLAGYSYTWILPRHIFINMGISLGVNLGINATEHAFLFIPQIKPKITFGHHNHSWSINTIMGSNSTIVVWDTVDILAPSTITVTFSKRF